MIGMGMESKGNCDDQPAALAEKVPRALHETLGLGEVLEDLACEDRVEGLHLQVGIEGVADSKASRLLDRWRLGR